MNGTIEDELTSYLRSEANRVTVHASLEDIERGVTLLSVAGSPKRRNVMLPILATAASVAAVVAMATVKSGRSTTEPVSAASEDVSITVPVTVPRVPLPAGAVLKGAAPSCTTSDNVEFQCSFTVYPGASLSQPESSVVIGQAEVIVDDTSHVSGGCRALTEDGLRWTCFVGRRAVDEGIVGENYFGSWASRGYTSG
jgi:hypothetical protein